MMTDVLIKKQGKIPLYLQLMTDELAEEQHELLTATYSMYCFWAGEALFGKVNGVIRTTAGYQAGKEVVKVEYDPTIITKSQLDKIADQSTCKPISAGSFKEDATPKYYLSNSSLHEILMMEIQKCRVNSALEEGQNAEIYLSPRQIDFQFLFPGLKSIV
jgi:peptide methionine sulfoxide reductase MsrA